MPPYNASGERVDAREVLDDAEYADYARAQSVRQVRRDRANFTGLRVDEYGYTRDGTWHPEYDGGGQ